MRSQNKQGNVGTADVLSKQVVRSSEEWLVGRSELRKRSGYHLIAVVGVLLIVAIYLLMQLDKLPNSSLSYSLLNALISVLFNFSSSALLKAFSFLISLLGLPRAFRPPYEG
jgi:hypothetical protein